MVSGETCDGNCTNGSSSAVRLNSRPDDKFWPGLELDVITDAFKLNRPRVKKLAENLELMTFNKVLANALALGPTKFVAGPLAIVVDLVDAGDLLEVYTYLVLAQGKMNGLVCIDDLLFLQNNQKYTDPLFKLRASLQHWV